MDRLFSPYRRDSAVSRIRRGALLQEDAGPLVADVAARCARASEVTGGLFAAERSGWFDPTGYVKGWAVERAARRHLLPLLDHEVAVGINAGGDAQLFTSPDSDWMWTVAIADPHEHGQVLATVEVQNGAIATSGTGERGHHIINPRTGLPCRDMASATVVSDGLELADLWATAAVVAGFDDISWISRADTRTGLLVSSGGEVRRWLGEIEISVSPVRSVPVAA